MNRQIYEEASDWLVELRTEDIDAAARQRFEKWLSASPEHVQAYLELASVWEVVSAGEPAGAEVAGSLIERARVWGNIVPLDVPAAGESRGDERIEVPRWRRRPFFTTILSVAASLLIMISAAGIWFYTQRNTYSTAVGEQRSILLSDGSTIALNARSTVRVRYNETARDIELLAGQALFHVAKDASRPFIVTSNQAKVRAVGTRFDVNQLRRATIVTVVEGTVSVSAGTSGIGARSMPSLELLQLPTTRRAESTESGRALAKPQGTTLLTAGEQAALTAGAPVTPTHADVVTATAWTERRLIFEATPLDEVAEEFNRYNTRRLVIQGAGLEDFHVSGGFSSSDPEPLLRFLRAQNGVQIDERNDEIIVSRRH